jgi:CubicO group peptidase (beta-lactamase class C family)
VSTLTREPLNQSGSAEIYYPPAESQGGWRWLDGSEEIRNIGGMDADALELVRQIQEMLHGGDSWGIVIIRHGYLVREFYTFNVTIPTRFDIWSGTKSFTGTAWGLLLDESRQGKLPAGQQVDLNSPAYQFLPEGYPLTDPRKERILIRHLLTMTSGIAGENKSIRGMPTSTQHGPFEYALGRSPNRFGIWVDQLVAEPGSVWDYSDPAMAHLSLLFANLMGREMGGFLQERVLTPIGIENLTWNIQGGSGFMGPHTNAHTGILASARELARFGYLALHKGQWAGQQLIPTWWMELATQSSQSLSPNYGFTWWVNSAGTQWPGLPHDAFSLAGYRSNRCYIIPSLDLVVARVGSGPASWDDQMLIGGVVKGILRE